MENNANELTFKDVVSRIFSQKTVLVAVTLIITILGTLFLGVIYSKSNIYYSSSFTLEYLGNQNLTMPDGTKLIYTDFISEDYLRAVKNSKPQEYKNIDVSKMSENDDIAISQDTKPSTVYTITIKKKYFENREVAKSFIKDIATYPILKIQQTMQNTGNIDFINDYLQEPSYDKKIELLIAQQTFILESYDNAIKTYGNLALQKGENKSLELATYKQNVVNYFTVNSLELLASKVALAGYAPKNENLVNAYKTQKSTLILEQEANAVVIKNIKDVVFNSSSSALVESEELIKLLKRQGEIENQINVLDDKIKFASGEYPANLTDTEKQAFEAFTKELDTAYSKILYYSQEYFDNIAKIYQNSSRISFTKASVIQEKGSISIVIAGGVSLVIGFVVACFSALLAYEVKRKYN